MPSTVVPYKTMLIPPLQMEIYILTIYELLHSLPSLKELMIPFFPIWHNVSWTEFPSSLQSTKIYANQNGMTSQVFEWKVGVAECCLRSSVLSPALAVKK